MKISTKERLNDKARKMIDLIYDEVKNTGEKEIITTFIDDKSRLKTTLSVNIKVSNPVDEDEVIDEDVIDFPIDLDDGVDDDI